MSIAPLAENALLKPILDLITKSTPEELKIMIDHINLVGQVMGEPILIKDHGEVILIEGSTPYNGYTYFIRFVDGEHHWKLEIGGKKYDDHHDEIHHNSYTYFIKHGILYRDVYHFTKQALNGNIEVTERNVSYELNQHIFQVNYATENSYVVPLSQRKVRRK